MEGGVPEQRPDFKVGFVGNLEIEMSLVSFRNPAAKLGCLIVVGSAIRIVLWDPTSLPSPTLPT